jgi:hypothetical protein
MQINKVLWLSLDADVEGALNRIRLFF